MGEPPRFLGGGGGGGALVAGGRGDPFDRVLLLGWGISFLGLCFFGPKGGGEKEGGK